MANRLHNIVRWAASRPPSFWLTVFIVNACLALVAVTSLRTRADRHAEIAQAYRSTINLAQALAQHAEDTIEIADTVIVGVVNRLERDDPALRTRRRLEDYVQFAARETPRLSGLFVYDEQGEWLATTAAICPAGANNSDRDYFKFHQASQNRRPHVGAPVQSKSRGAWIITVSRRFNYPDGSFAGVVAATIDAAYFVNRYRDFDIGEQGSINLIRTDGAILVRRPSHDLFVGRDTSSTALFREHLQKASVGGYQQRSSLDQVERLFGYAKSSRHPIVVLASLGAGVATASFGVAAFEPDSGATAIAPESLIAAADAALYRAKADGRNRVVVSPARRPALRDLSAA